MDGLVSFRFEGNPPVQSLGILHPSQQLGGMLSTAEQFWVA